MKFTISQISQLLEGEIEGDDTIEIRNVARIEEAKKGDIAFIFDPKYEKCIYDTQASALIISKDLALIDPVNVTLIRVNNPYLSFLKILNIIDEAKKKRKNYTDISKFAYIDEEATIGNNVSIGHYSVVCKNSVISDNTILREQVYIGENVHIGKNCYIYPQVVILEDCEVGDNCIIHSGAIIGSDGFGFFPKEDGTYEKIPQIGNVIIENNVEIGANVSIDRSTLGSTRIKEGTKLDNLIHIAHNVVVGKNNAMAAQCGIAGSTKIGDNNMFGGQVGISEHISIRNNNKIAAQSGIASNVSDNEMLMGSPAIDAKAFKRNFIAFKELAEIRNKVYNLDKLISNLIKNDKTKDTKK
ncbi:MAG: UDP-3-O-(3-hydroxymyristoyl)glucosamine N-acyltransferase [Bacteroidales bacterium]|jgi:UDP-3-O-[3-hydroxymyristoyl] glucosamine N-acyltransferase|nr:UDP-3-O-(3-hydroxymyristoyl)glucosamine N-acyltransferase [Bacteroidales bacterium]